jgi:hypothetical protein
LEKRLHIFFSLFLLISFSWQCAAKTVIFLSFKFNQKELAATVCENKDKPKSCCAAKCYLEKEIKKEDKRQSDSSSSLKDKTEKVELKTGFVTFVFAPAIAAKQMITSKSGDLPDAIYFSIFHPPSL